MFFQLLVLLELKITTRALMSSTFDGALGAPFISLGGLDTLEISKIVLIEMQDEVLNVRQLLEQILAGHVGIAGKVLEDPGKRIWQSGHNVLLNVIS